MFAGSVFVAGARWLPCWCLLVTRSQSLSSTRLNPGVNQDPLTRALPAPGANPAGLASAQAESEEGREDTSSRPFSAQIHRPDPGRRLARSSQRKRRNAPFRCFAFLRQVTVDVCDKRGQFLRAKEHVLLSGRNVVPLGSYAISFKNPF